MPVRESRSTWLAPEKHAYPHGRQTRKGAALFPDGKIRTVYAGIARFMGHHDIFFSTPAHARINGWYVAGFLTIDDEHRYYFNLNNMQGRKKTIPARNIFPQMYKETTQ